MEPWFVALRKDILPIVLHQFLPKTGGSVANEVGFGVNEAILAAGTDFKARGSLQLLLGLPLLSWLGDRVRMAHPLGTLFTFNCFK